MSTKLFVGSLKWEVTDDQLRELFSQAGNVVSAQVVADKFSGRSKGFGFVEMGSEEEAKAAVEKFNGYDFQGRPLVVNEARPKEDRPRRDRGNYSNNYR